MLKSSIQFIIQNKKSSIAPLPHRRERERERERERGVTM